MAIIIDGKLISAQIKQEIKDKTELLLKNKGIKPGLALLLVGEDPASQSYVASKERACSQIGFNSIIVRMPETASEQEVLELVQKWNNDDCIHGILVQLPLPKHINENKVILAIKPSKDVDGFHPENIGRLVIGLPGFVSCTPAGIMELISRYKIETKGKHCVVLGRSNIVGKPIANLMYQKKDNANCIVTIAHTAAQDISYYTKQADILIAAVGVPKLIKAKDIKQGAVIIDVGINRIDAPDSPKGYRNVGDVDYDDVFDKVSAITPVPGGVGLMTVAMLMSNTYLSASGEMKFD
jgi:methylenetetrahydrofolate dehydrogenase (NADP+) / methenyltetrahydrofolate cyclohydrolase